MSLTLTLIDDPNASDDGTAEAVPVRTLRDQFAGEAMRGILSADNFQRGLAGEQNRMKQISVRAYEMADIMLVAREETAS